MNYNTVTSLLFTLELQAVSLFRENCGKMQTKCGSVTARGLFPNAHATSGSGIAAVQLARHAHSRACTLSYFRSSPWIFEVNEEKRLLAVYFTFTFFHFFFFVWGVGEGRGSGERRRAFFKMKYAHVWTILTYQNHKNHKKFDVCTSNNYF